VVALDGLAHRLAHGAASLSAAVVVRQHVAGRNAVRHLALLVLALGNVLEGMQNVE
jgi:anaerobic selenocysteine-containing dehydrogenase